MPNDKEWKVGDLVKIKLSNNIAGQFIGCISNIFIVNNVTYCNIGIMDEKFGSDTLTFPTYRLASVE